MKGLDSPSKTVAASRCPLCGEVLSPANPEQCPACDWVRGYRHRSTGGSERDRVAAILSVVPGMGHLYKGHRTGWAFLVGTLLAIYAAALAATPTMGLGLLLLPCYWIWVVAQAYWIEDRRE